MPFISDSCYLGALVGWTSVSGSHEYLNQMKNLVQNPYVYQQALKKSLLQGKQKKNGGKIECMR